MRPSAEGFRRAASSTPPGGDFPGRGRWLRAAYDLLTGYRSFADIAGLGLGPRLRDERPGDQSRIVRAASLECDHGRALGYAVQESRSAWQRAR